MLSRVITLVLVAIAISAAASAQERLPRAPEVAPSNTGDGRPIDQLSGFAAPSASTSAKAGAPKRVVVRRAPTLDLMTRVTVTRGLKSTKYRVPQADPIKKPGLDAGAGD